MGPDEDYEELGRLFFFFFSPPKLGGEGEGGRVLKRGKRLMLRNMTGQVFKGSATLHGYSGHDQVFVQGYVDVGL